LLNIVGLGWFVAAYRMAPFVLLWPTIPASGWLDDRFLESCHNEGIHLGFPAPI
jgi:hypothetical protein